MEKVLWLKDRNYTDYVQGRPGNKERNGHHNNHASHLENKSAYQLKLYK